MTERSRFINKRIACPACRDEGRDSSGNHLHLFEGEEAGWCNHGHGYVRVGGEDGQQQGGNRRVSYQPSNNSSALTLHVVSQSYPVMALAERGITAETCERFGVRCSVSEQTGDVDAHFYPYHDSDGNLSGYKKRSLPKDFAVIGKIKGLFGQNLCRGGKFVVVTEGECLSGDTEVMTDAGWVRLDAYDGERVLSVREDNTAAYEDALAYIKKEYDGDLLSFSNAQVSFAVTPKHNMVVRSRTQGKPWVKQALEDCGVSQREVPKVVLQNGPGLNLSNDEIAVAIAISADAYLRQMVANGPIRKKGQWLAKFGLDRQRKKDRLEGLFERLSIPYKKYNSHTRPSKSEYVLTMPGFCPGRFLPLEWITQSTLEQKRFIIEELVHWDGNRVPNRNQYEYSSKYLENAEWVQMLCHTAGVSATIIERSNPYGEWYKVSMLLGKSSACFFPERLEKIKPQDGFVYCVQTTTGRLLIRKDRKVMVIGNCDALAASQMLRDMGKTYNVVSIPNGANEEGKLDQTLLRELEWLAAFEGVALCLDQDKPGQATAVALAELLASQTKVKIVQLPHKDAGKMLELGLSGEFLRCLNSSKAYHPEAVVEGKDLRMDDFRKSKQPGVALPYPKLQAMTWGLRKGEITLVVSGPGLGKSTFVREVCFDLSQKGYKVANIALETPMDDLVNTYVAMDNNVPPYKLLFNKDVLSDEVYQASFDKLFTTGNMNFFQWWGNIASDRLMSKMMYFAKSLGVDFIMLDHVSIAILGEEDERLEIDRLFEKLTRLVVETGVGVLAVMHLRKVPGKSFNRGGEVELEDIRGSAGAAQMSWNVWALERDQQGDAKDVLKVRVLKNRLLGFTGEADHLVFQHQTGRLVPLQLQTEY